MNKEVLKVFLKLKLKEIGIFILCLVGLVIVSFVAALLIAGITLIVKWVLPYITPSSNIILVLLLCLILFIVFITIKYWFKSNWKKAEKIVRERKRK